MIIVELSGGLGNQMFQYAFATKLHNVYPNEILKFDTSFFKSNQANGRMDRRIEELYKFGIKYQLATRRDVVKSRGYVCSGRIDDKIVNAFGKIVSRDGLFISEDLDGGYLEDYLRIPAQRKDKIVFYSGYWQSEQYFIDIRPQILQAFTFSAEGMDAKCRDIAEEINQTNSVSMHIRRGDYLNEHNSKVLGGICTVEYYNRAIEVIKSKVSNPHFFIFSNDMKWVKQNIIEDNTTYVECNGEEKHEYDMYLMTLCKNHIIANSSFSWWGAWLCDYPDKIVVAPDRWFHNHEICDQICDDWIRIEI